MARLCLVLTNRSGPGRPRYHSDAQGPVGAPIGVAAGRGLVKAAPSSNACLNARRANARRVLPETLGPPADNAPLGAPETEIAWLEPYPDAALEGIADVAPGPDARYEMHEAVQFAFVAATQELPPRQRAVLLLRDLLGWSAGETAVLLDASVASINSALQRARATLKHRFPSGRPGAQPVPNRCRRISSACCSSAT